MVRIQRPQLATLDPMLRLPRVADRRAGFKNEHIPIPLDAGILGRTVEAAVRPATRNNSADDTNLVCLRTRTALELPGDCDGVVERLYRLAADICPHDRLLDRQTLRNVRSRWFQINQ